jgi:predicted regulator of Ras-like GTPase activity (Roadblock/LC7/MglB family)
MATEQQRAGLTPILQDLQARIEGLEDLVILHDDRTVLAAVHLTEKDLSATSLMTDFAKVIDEMCDTLEHGIATEAMVKGGDRFLALYKLHETDVLLGILGRSHVNLGLLNSGCRTAIEKIHKMLSA